MEAEATVSKISEHEDQIPSQDNPEAEAPARPPVVILPPEGCDLDDIQREAVTQALMRTNGVQKDAAALLRITPRVMNYKVRKVFRIDLKELKKQLKVDRS